MNNKKTKFSLVDEYRKVKPIYEACTEKFISLIITLIKESGLKVHSITRRTKDIESFSKKISGKIETYKKVSDITDLSGVRICCYLSSQVENVAKLIKDNFIIIPEQSVDKRETIDPDRFGYLSLHYVVKLADKRTGLPEYNKYKNLLCEIQIRTILQHAWAKIEHDLGYKSKIGIPKNIRRQFSRLAGLLELADEQFDNIKLQIEDYSFEIKNKISSKRKEVAIDNISMETYILYSPLVKKIDEELAEKGNWVLIDETNTEFSVRMSNYFNIKSIQELENVIKKEKTNIIKFTKIYFKNITVFKGKVPMPKGISLFYLGYLLISRLKELDSIKNYLKSMKITSGLNLDKASATLIRTINKLMRISAS